MYFYEYMDDSPALIRLQTKYVRKSLGLLVDALKGHDWELTAQVALWVTAGSLVMQLGHVTYPYIKKCCEAVNVAGFQFIPTYGRPAEFSEDLHEKLSVLSQIIYYENFWFLTCGGAEPTMTAKIEKEFRYRLQVPSTSSWLFTSHVQRSLTGGLPDIVQHLSVDHAHTNNSAGERHGDYTRPSSDRW